MLKKKKASVQKVKKYQSLLDSDFAGNKIVICAYQSSLLKTVQNLLIQKSKGKSSHQATIGKPSSGQ